MHEVDDIVLLYFTSISSAHLPVVAYILRKNQPRSAVHQQKRRAAVPYGVQSSLLLGIMVRICRPLEKKGEHTVTHVLGKTFSKAAVRIP